MFYCLFLICLFLTKISCEYPSDCLLLNNKLNKYGIHINNQEKNLDNLKICQGLTKNSCCPSIYEDQIHNATITELYHLFESYSINFYKQLFQVTNQLNDTIRNLIDLSRNETYLILYNSKSYHSSIDLFYKNLFEISSKHSYNDIQTHIDNFFQNILHITLKSNDENQSISPSNLLCFWKNHPFGNRPNLIGKILEINLGKLFNLYNLFKLNLQLIQAIITSVTTDYQCIDAYIQFSYCNLCSGHKQLPCLSDCRNIIEHCVGNVSNINDVWIHFIDNLDSLENLGYFHGIENSLLSIGKSISDALMTFFSSDGIHNKDILNQCGHINIRQEIFDHNRKYVDKNQNFFISEYLSIKNSLKIYRSFWLLLPNEICKSNEYISSNEQVCSSGIMNKDINSNKSLNLRLQIILDEIKDKSNMIKDIQQNTITDKNTLFLKQLKLNSTENLDDYPNDNGLDYSDYAYEDSGEETTTTTTTSSTTTQTTTLFIDDDETNTVAYYDYGDQNAYSDDESDDLSTQRMATILTTTITTSTIRIPFYHQRKPVIWNINMDDNDDDFDKYFKQSNSSSIHNYSFLFLIIIDFIFLYILLK